MKKVLLRQGEPEKIPFYELFVDGRIDAKHSYEDAIMPVTEAKKKYGEKIAILGGVDVDREPKQ